MAAAGWLPRGLHGFSPERGCLDQLLIDARDATIWVLKPIEARRACKNWCFIMAIRNIRMLVAAREQPKQVSDY